MRELRGSPPRRVCQLPAVTPVPEKLRLSAARDVGIWLHPAQSSEGGAPVRLRFRHHAEDRGNPAPRSPTSYVLGFMSRESTALAGPNPSSRRHGEAMLRMDEPGSTTHLREGARQVVQDVAASNTTPSKESLATCVGPDLRRDDGEGR